AVAAAGKRSDRIAWRLFTEVVRPLLKGAERMTIALGDTPTKRYGPHVQEAGIHHNPAPGPSGSPYVDRPRACAVHGSSSSPPPGNRRLFFSLTRLSAYFWPIPFLRDHSEEETIG